MLLSYVARNETIEEFRDLLSKDSPTETKKCIRFAEVACFKFKDKTIVQEVMEIAVKKNGKQQAALWL